MTILLLCIIAYLYLIGSIASLCLSTFVQTTLHHKLAPKQIGAILIWCLFWPIVAPLFITNVIIKTIIKRS